jgi:hypothetical protein
MWRVIGLTGELAIKSWPPDDPLAPFLVTAVRRARESGGWLSRGAAEPLPDPWRRAGRSRERGRRGAERGMAGHA